MIDNEQQRQNGGIVSNVNSVGTVVNNNSVGQYSRPALPAQTEEALANMIPNSRKSEVIIVPEPDKSSASVAGTASKGKSVTPLKTNTVVKSRKRTSLDEFAHRARIRPEIKAGFRAWLRGQHFAFDDEWEQLFKDYNNRKI